MGISKIESRYEIHSIEKGGMGIVYLCYDYKERMPVAIKTFQERFMTDNYAITRFIHEASMWVNVGKHKNIVQAYSVENINHRPYIFLEYITGDNNYGPNLRGWIRKKALDLKTLLNFALQFCIGMVYLEKKFKQMNQIFVHRDVKPENIMVAKDKTVKITDFGLVKTFLAHKDSFEITKPEGKSEAERIGFTKADFVCVIEALIFALQNDKSWVVRFVAAESLGEMGSTEAVDALIGALNDIEPTVVKYAAEALGKIGDEKAIPFLLATLRAEEGKDFAPCEAAAEALTHFGEKVIQPLMESLNDEGRRSAAIIALGLIAQKTGNATVLQALSDILVNDSVQLADRKRAAEALGKIRTTMAIKALTVALSKTSHYPLLDSIAASLEKVGADPDLVKAANKKAALTLMENLSKIKEGVTTEEELTNLVGYPVFSMKQSAALGVFRNIIAIGTHNGEKEDRENCTYRTKFGDFSITLSRGIVVGMSGIESLIEKLKKEGAFEGKVFLAVRTKPVGKWGFVRPGTEWKIKLTPSEIVIWDEEGKEQVKVSKEKAAGIISFPGKTHTGKGETQHLHGLPLLQVGN